MPRYEWPLSAKMAIHLVIVIVGFWPYSTAFTKMSPDPLQISLHMIQWQQFGHYQPLRLIADDILKRKSHADQEIIV